ncbi:hypothetical protein [Stenotrophomonas maltophilia]|uniref:hypothetical protein n=1 Tax=Stenotrophomonas maltophilia TaxID=40324 RepID=UPI0013DA8739|nr:hypothetical protein [Stenotrophomonas maltophilia]
MSEAAYLEATVATLEGVIVGHAAANPAGYVSFISGMGAEPGSRMMPLQVKGQAEQVLARSGLAHTSLRPGVLRPVLGWPRRIGYAVACMPWEAPCWRRPRVSAHRFSPAPRRFAGACRGW